MKHYKSPNGELFAYEPDGSQDHLIPNDFTLVTDSEADAHRQQIAQARRAALTYAQRRSLEYPSITDQLDAFWKGGADAEAMRAQVMAVKAKHPK